MKKIIKLFSNWIVIGLWFLFIIWIGYIIIKARSSTNPWLTEQSPVGGLYVNNGDTLTAAKWNKLVDDSYKPYVSLKNSSNVSVGSHSSVRVDFDTENSDVDDLHDSSNPTRITIKKTWKYLVSTRFMIAYYSSNAQRSVIIYKNRSQAIVPWEVSNDSNTSDINVSWLVSLTAWDYLEVYCRNWIWASLAFTPKDFSIIYLWS